MEGSYFVHLDTKREEEGNGVKRIGGIIWVGLIWANTF